MANLKQYLPSIYEGVVETDALTVSEEKLFDELAARILEVEYNAFIVTAQEQGIKQYEDLLGIVNNPVETTPEYLNAESDEQRQQLKLQELDSRRRRLLNRFAVTKVVTMQSLKNKLDSILGVGTYSAYMDKTQPYTLVVESAAEDQLWYHELLVTINNSKPANILFINKPLVSGDISTDESIKYSQWVWHYKLGSWNLGLEGTNPFVSFVEQQGEAKMAVQSIDANLLNYLATQTKDNIVRVKLNGVEIITPQIRKTVVGGTLTIEYDIPPDSNRPEINLVELLDNRDNVLTRAKVHIGALSDITIKHTIRVKEG